MAIFESLFDISYLAIVIGLGVRLLLEKNSLDILDLKILGYG